MLKLYYLHCELLLSNFRKSSWGISLWGSVMFGAQFSFLHFIGTQHQFLLGRCWLKTCTINLVLVFHIQRKIWKYIYKKFELTKGVLLPADLNINSNIGAFCVLKLSKRILDTWNFQVKSSALDFFWAIVFGIVFGENQFSLYEFYFDSVDFGTREIWTLSKWSNTDWFYSLFWRWFQCMKVRV